MKVQEDIATVEPASAAKAISPPARKPRAVRISRRLARKAARAVVILVLLLAASGFASYKKARPFSAPFNYTVAALGNVVLGIPFKLGTTALDDGLLAVMIDKHSVNATHHWLKGANPHKIDYEAAMRASGWNDPALHRVGRVLRLCP